MFAITNATRAVIVAWVNSLLAVSIVFGVPLSDRQEGAIILAVNNTLGLWIALTYKNSPKRIPDPPGTPPL